MHDARGIYKEKVPIAKTEAKNNNNNIGENNICVVLGN